MQLQKLALISKRSGRWLLTHNRLSAFSTKPTDEIREERDKSIKEFKEQVENFKKELNIMVDESRKEWMNTVESMFEKSKKEFSDQVDKAKKEFSSSKSGNGSLAKDYKARLEGFNSILFTVMTSVIAVMASILFVIFLSIGICSCLQLFWYVLKS